MPVSGSFDALAELKTQIASLANGRTRSDLCKVLAEASMKQLDDEFRGSRDPYGASWAPLTSRTGQPLRDTGAHLQNSLSPKSSENGWTISTAFVGAAVHQYGATIRPKTAKALAFRVRGAPMKSNKRGKLSAFIFAKQVTIPRRQYMPENDIGPIWHKALESQANDFIHRRMHP